MLVFLFLDTTHPDPTDLPNPIFQIEGQGLKGDRETMTLLQSNLTHVPIWCWSLFCCVKFTCWIHSFCMNYFWTIVTFSNWYWHGLYSSIGLFSNIMRILNIDINIETSSEFNLSILFTYAAIIRIVYAVVVIWFTLV